MKRQHEAETTLRLHGVPENILEQEWQDQVQKQTEKLNHTYQV